MRLIDFVNKYNMSDLALIFVEANQDEWIKSELEKKIGKIMSVNCEGN